MNARSDGEVPVAAPGNERDGVSDHVNQNINSIAAFHQRESEKLSAAERRLAHISDLIGRPFYLVGILCFVAVWTTCTLLASRGGRASFDPPPYPLLHGLLTLVALLTATVVLIRQNRHVKLAEQRAHLDLQVNLLTEQKVTKLIHLLEELRRDLPMVRDRHDPEATSLQLRTDTASVLSALETVQK